MEHSTADGMISRAITRSEQTLQMREAEYKTKHDELDLTVVQMQEARRQIQELKKSLEKLRS